LDASEADFEAVTWDARFCVVAVVILDLAEEYERAELKERCTQRRLVRVSMFAARSGGQQEKNKLQVKIMKSREGIGIGKIDESNRFLVTDSTRGDQFLKVIDWRPILGHRSPLLLPGIRTVRQSYLHYGRSRLDFTRRQGYWSCFQI
jgi:hypothetical protein